MNDLLLPLYIWMMILLLPVKQSIIAGKEEEQKSWHHKSFTKSIFGITNVKNNMLWWKGDVKVDLNLVVDINIIPDKGKPSDVRIE